MNVKHLLDKSKWPPGPWMDEPDHVTWIHLETGYRCLMRRNVLGAWCGFVGLTSRHTLFMVPHTEQVFQFIDVHGNAAYTSFNDEESLCFSPAERTWWVGFDAMQDTDHCPGYAADTGDVPKSTRTRRLKGKTSTIAPKYRDYAFILREVGFLAVQLAMFNEGD